MDQDKKNLDINSANGGLNLNFQINQIKKGELTFALNAQLGSNSGDLVSYQNEQSNEQCIILPNNYQVIGKHLIPERDLVIFFLLNSLTGDSEIGKGDLLTCSYEKIINAKCLNFNVSYPILKAVHRTTNCGLEIYWVDALNNARFIDLDNLPFKEIYVGTSCGNVETTDIDCNKLNLQPNFSIFDIEVKESLSGGELKSGTYQFAAQYCNSIGEPYTSFYSITNPGGIFIGTQISEDFDFPINKAIELEINNIDTTGIYDYINIAAIRTVNNITSVDLIGTYKIDGPSKNILYTGQSLQRLDINDIFQRYELYDAPSDITVAQDVLILKDLKGENRISYQNIANKIKLYWQTNRLNGDSTYSKLSNTINFKGYMRDEVYPFSIVFELDNGHITDEFPLIGRPMNDFDKEIIDNKDTLINADDDCKVLPTSLPRYKVYNTATKISNLYPDNYDSCYEGPWEYGEFAYVESTELYPCDPETWGDLAGTPIRHFKFPDNLVTDIYDKSGYVYPIGVRIDVNEVVNLIRESTLTDEQKSRIKGFRIVRGNRANNETVIAKGLISNVLKYSTNDNIIPSTGEVDSNGNTVDNSYANLIKSAYDYTDRARRNFVKSRFLGVVGTITVGSNVEQDKRYAKTEKLLEQVRNSPDFFTLENVEKLREASSLMTEIIDNSMDDVRGEAQITAAQTIVDALIEITLNQIDLRNSIIASTIDIEGDALLTDYSNYNYFPNYLFNDLRVGSDGKPSDFFLDNTIIDESTKKRYTLHSPDTSFYQPSLGNILKLETIQQGVSSGHLVEVQKHAKYQFISKTGYLTSILAGVSIGFLSGTYGVAAVNVFNGEAGFTAYQTFLDILYKTVPRKNFAYQWNALGTYNQSIKVPNSGNKQRLLDIVAYMGSGMQNMGDDHIVNNYQRESSVYLRTTEELPFTHEVGATKDSSKIAIPSYEVLNMPISSYYASLKRRVDNQYGQIGTYEIVDTGYRKTIDTNRSDYGTELVMGGDTFINKFAYKSKFPFFIDNRVNFPDDSGVSYNELSNVGRVKYWFSTDVETTSSVFSSFFATMTQNFFWPEIYDLYQSGKIFLFAYGIPYFFCESTVNVDMRQAFNPREGDFYPRVSSGIPDTWLQEINVPIAQDNTYYYNKSFSKQNKETFYSRLPIDFKEECVARYPFRAIFSEPATDVPNPSLRNNWRIFKPASRFDFPQNYGKLISLDGIGDREVLARFENKTLLYNALATVPTNTIDAYLGSSLFNKQIPPLDFADTDMGYNGTQHKFLLKTEYGHISIDSRRGQILLINGRNIKDLGREKVGQFLINNLDFEIKKTFPDINIDNHYNGIGLHGIYDSKYDRFIITKLDYRPLDKNIKYENNKFYLNSKEIQLTDTNYFQNNSFTLSFSFEIGGEPISFHSYEPRYYVGGNNVFYSGIPGSLWRHNSKIDSYCVYYNQQKPYVIEYPFGYPLVDESLDHVSDYTKVLKYNADGSYVEVDNKYFSKALLYNNQQCSGELTLVEKPKNKLSSYLTYPKYSEGKKEITYVKVDNQYIYNNFCDLVKDKSQPIFVKTNSSIFKQLNTSNISYKKPGFKESFIVAKDLKVRHILEESGNHKFISQFILAPSKYSIL